MDGALRLAPKIKISLFESDRRWLKENGIGYSEFIRNLVHTRIATIRNRDGGALQTGSL